MSLAWSKDKSKQILDWIVEVLNFEGDSPYNYFLAETGEHF